MKAENQDESPGKGRKVNFADHVSSPASPATYQSESAKKMLTRLGFGDQSLNGAFPDVDFEKMKESKSSFGAIKAHETDLQERDDSDDDESEIEDDSSASDDKT